MIWLWYALATAIGIAIVTLLEKRILNKEHATEFVVTLSIVNLIFSIPLFLHIPYQSLTAIPLLLLLGTGVLSVCTQILNARSLRHMDVSATSPLYATTPAMTAVLAFLFLGEALSLYQILGIVILFAGTYLLEKTVRTPSAEPQVRTPIKYVYFIFLSIFLYGICALIDRYILTHYYAITPQALLAFAHLFLAIGLCTYFFIRYDGWTGIRRSTKTYGLSILLISAITVLYRFAELKSIQLASVGIVVAIVKSSSLFSTILGGKLFKEKHIGIKALACIVIIAGVVLVVI
jgi:drug/metabolite transporter (DMT)-like permease